jgi:hypothetical protein
MARYAEEEEEASPNQNSNGWAGLDTGTTKQFSTRIENQLNGQGEHVQTELELLADGNRKEKPKSTSGWISAPLATPTH